MASSRSTPPPSERPNTKSTELSVDHALALSLADETEAALRWGAAALELGMREPEAVIVTSRLLEQMGRRRAAIEGLGLAVGRAIDEGNLPLAMAAVGELRALGVDAEGPIDQVASTFCLGAARLKDMEVAPVLPQLGDFQPLSPFLTGPALASKATKILEAAMQSTDDVVGREQEKIEPLPLFSTLPMDALRDLLAAFETLLVGAGESVIREGEESGAAFLVARGELEIARRSTTEGGAPVLLTRLGPGSFFGEMALLSHLPGAATVVATRPSILLVARRERIEAVAARHPIVGEALATHCRRLSVANLGWASPVIVAVPARERATLVDRFETRIFEAGEKLVESGRESDGLHLIVSGEVSVVAYDGDERVVLATLLPGETVGEVELVLCRPGVADSVAVRPTATLWLPREEFLALVQDHPAILHGLYAIAVRRHNETRQALEAVSAAVADEMLDDAVPAPAAASPAITVPAPAPAPAAAASPPPPSASLVPTIPGPPVKPASLPPPALPGRASSASYPGGRRRRSSLPPPMMPQRTADASPPPPPASPTIDIIAPTRAGTTTVTSPAATPPSSSKRPSVGPTIATIPPPSAASGPWERARGPAQLALVAVAAGFVAYFAFRGEPAKSSPTTASRGADVGEVPAPPQAAALPPAVLAAPAPTASLSSGPAPSLPPAGSPSPATQRFVSPTMVASRPRTIVTMEPAPVNAARPVVTAPAAVTQSAAPAPIAATPAPAPSAVATPPQPPKPATPFAPTVVKAPVKDALSATEYGGRE
jgi:cAMP-dependent protein kinase regulator